jgi:hypothetical protein
MHNIITLFLSVLLLCSALVIGDSDSAEPEIEIEADFITVGFEDHSTIQLTKGSPEFKEINDEAIRIYQGICDQVEKLLGLKQVEQIKYSDKFVKMEFIEPPVVTTYTDQGEVYKILDVPSVIFVFTGEHAGFVLCGAGTTVEWPEWAVLVSRRGFRNLEKMVNSLTS